MKDIIAQLNPAQREAVINYDGPSQIVAGAGSGKTRVLTSRIAYMIAQEVKPWNILALTFTNKAAAEMRERIGTIIGDRSRYIQMGTFHSIFLRILRAEADRIGYPAAFTIYDTTDSQSLVKSICRDMLLADNEKYKPRAVFSKISRLKNDLITPAVYEQDPAFVTDDRKRGQEKFLEIYKRYTAQCKANGAMDFDDLLLNMVVLLKNNPDVLAKYREKFRYVLVDEYQDTNHVQYLIVKALAMTHGNVCVVGDDSQSIYSFRGARIENILNFKRDFPSAQVYKLEQNYRSTQVIVNAANGVIARNESSRELKKECFSAGERGENIKLIKAYTDREEAEKVATEIRDLGRGGIGRDKVRWSDVAVLYRVNALSRNIEESLRRREIPYKIYRGHSFFDRKEIKDMIAYFRLIVNPRDDEAFKRVINYPARGIGDVTVAKIAAAARDKETSMWETVEAMGAAAVTAEEKTLAKKTAAFAELIRSLSLSMLEKPLYEFGMEVATRTGIVGGYKAERTPEATSALENIDELLNSMVASNSPAPLSQEDEEPSEPGPLSLDEWLQTVALMTDMDEGEAEDRNKVTLMTVHSAKGLEFRHVFIIGLEEELFPSVRDGDASEMEEERRLFYVALTRAKERSYLSLAETRFIHGSMAFRRPSRFVREIDAKYIDGSAADEGRESGPPQRPAWDSGRSAWEANKPSWQARKEGDKPAWGARKPETQQYGGQQQYGQRSGYPARTAAPGREPEPPQRVAPVTPDARFRKMAATPDTRVEHAKSSPPQDASTGTPAISGNFAPGARVAHAKFGRGTVEAVEAMSGGSASDLKITVAFDDGVHGRKTLLSKFAKLEIV
ncbi:MAG: UvrD-helicase domain-containing protein [Alistipes sp.]|jgi:DNA helicase-2/ATP-dependent DNA helicase PcrA|nr:UvrD-helicase domain-containing protein [Alistipes sp.]